MARKDGPRDDKVKKVQDNGRSRTLYETNHTNNTETQQQQCRSHGSVNKEQKNPGNLTHRVRKKNNRPRKGKEEHQETTNDKQRITNENSILIEWRIEVKGLLDEARENTK